jgi:hypothetical protein
MRGCVVILSSGACFFLRVFNSPYLPLVVGPIFLFSRYCTALLDSRTRGWGHESIYKEMQCPSNRALGVIGRRSGFQVLGRFISFKNSYWLHFLVLFALGAEEAMFFPPSVDSGIFYLDDTLS